MQASPNHPSPNHHGLSTLVLATIVPIVAVVTVVVTLAVTSDDAGTASPAGGEANGTRVTIKDFAFAPTVLHVAAGSTVTVTNADDATHTMTADDGAFDTGDLDGGAHATITIDAPGRYRYFCDIHNYMTGTIEAS